jgi:hypothetical protein
MWIWNRVSFLFYFLFFFWTSVDTSLGESLKDFALSSVQQELNTIESSDAESKGYESQSPSARHLLWQSVSSIISTLSLDDRVQKVSRRVLWHPALHLENIIVSADNHTQIEGITGWRFSQVLPIFLQARFPEFLEPPTLYQFGDSLPSLSGFNEMSPEKKAEALERKKLAAQCKYYEACLAEGNKLANDAMMLDRGLVEPFQHCLSRDLVSLCKIREWKCL